MRFKLYIFSILLIGAAISPDLCAQVNTMYYMTGIPQSHVLNPATQPNCNIFVGIPIASSVYIESGSSSIQFDDLFWEDPESGQIIHPLHPSANQDDFLAKFEEKNTFVSNAYLKLFSLGFGVKSMYFTLDVTSRLNQSISYPGDLMYFLISGNENGQTFNFSSLGMNSMEFIEYAVGISKKFNNQLTVGIKPKFMAGISNITSNNNDISLYTSYDEWILSAQMEINTSLPGVTLPVNENGGFDPEGEADVDSNLIDPSRIQALALGNPGFGIDLGVHYRPIKQLELSLSVLDLGYIKWKNYTNTSYLEGSYTFDGVELSLSDTSSNFMGEISDSILNSIEFTGNADAFTNYLLPKIIVGGRYFITKKFDVGAIARIDFSDAGTFANLILLTNWRPSSMFSLSASYKPTGGTANTFGLGTSFSLGPINLYLVSDYIPTSYRMVNNVPVPTSQKNFNFRVGINLVFGCNQRKRLMADKPMYYSAEY